MNKLDINELEYFYIQVFSISGGGQRGNSANLV